MQVAQHLKFYFSQLPCNVIIVAVILYNEKSISEKFNPLFNIAWLWSGVTVLLDLLDSKIYVLSIIMQLSLSLHQRRENIQNQTHTP